MSIFRQDKIHSTPKQSFNFKAYEFRNNLIKTTSETGHLYASEAEITTV